MSYSSHKIDGELDGLLSNYLRQKRVSMATPFIDTSGPILDIGCGMCPWATRFSHTVAYTGLDIEPDITHENQKNHPFWNFQTCNLEEEKALDTLPNQHFKTIIMLAVLEHFADPLNVVQKLSDKLINGGEIVMTTPAPWADIILDTGAIFGIFAKDKHQHHKLMGKTDIEKLSNQANLTLIKYKRFLFVQNQLIILHK